MTQEQHPSTIDRGWAWVVLLGVALQHMLSSTIYMTGIFNLGFLEEFTMPASQTAVIGSLLPGIFCFSGPLASWVLELLGARRTVFLGTGLCMTGFLLAAVSPTYVALCVSYGVIAGVGTAFTYLPGIVSLSMYFCKFRYLAYGLVTAAVGIGQIAIATLTSNLIEWYGWRGAMVVMAGVIAHYAITASVLWPIEQSDLPIKDSALEVVSDTPTEILNGQEKHLNNATVCLKDSSEGIRDRLLVNKELLCSNTLPQDNFPRECHSETGSQLASSITLPTNKDIPLSIPQRLLNKTDAMFYISSHSLQHSNISIAKPVFDTTSTDPNSSDVSESKTTLKVIPALFCNLVFTLYFLSQIAVTLGQSCVFIHLPAFAVSTGASVSQASRLIAIMGLAIVPSRLLTGIVTNKQWCSPLTVYVVSLVLCGISVLVVPFVATQYRSQMAFALLFAFWGNCQCATFTTLLIYLLDGLQNVTTASGLMLLADGIGFLAGPPIAGLFFDLTGLYTTAFYFSGASIVVSALIMLPAMLQRRQK